MMKPKMWALVFVVAGGLVLYPMIASRNVEKVNPEKHQLSTDVSEIKKHLPFLGPIESCSWISGVVEDHSGGFLPGPSSVFLRGHAILPDQQIAGLRNKFVWRAASEIDVNSLEVSPARQGLRGPVLESPDLVRSLPTESTFHRGRIFLFPEARAVYFDLIKD